MPIVFVHGVNNRKDKTFRDNEEGRSGFLRRIVGPSLGLGPGEIKMFNPYWGDEGAKFSWGMAVLPTLKEGHESFGGSLDGFTQADIHTMELLPDAGQTTDIVDLARKNLVVAVDLAYGSALARIKNQELAEGLAESFQRAMSYAETNPNPEWLTQAQPKNFVDLLNNAIEPREWESAGAGEIFQALKEGASRLIHLLPGAGTEVAYAFTRKKLNETVTRFAGDAFVYLAKRGTKDDPGPIVKIVMDALRKAQQEMSTSGKDKKLIVLVHSFGGEIVYDILTHFDPSIQVDCLVSIGSQIGLFEEMKLYLASDQGIGLGRIIPKVPKPPNIGKWLNVFDTNDIFSYQASAVFDGVEDFAYDTGYGALGAHGGYFLRPSFYVRLAKRLAHL